MAELDPSRGRLTHTIVTPGDGSVVVSLDGELDIASADRLNLAVQDVLAGASICLVVDVERLRFADSSAIALWVGWSKKVPRLEIRNPSPMVLRVIEAMGLTNVLHPS
jgi:anti-anti-sigma factor